MKNFTTIAALITVGLTTSALHADGTSAAQFLKMGAGARAAAMGNAYTAVADDVTAGYWNPAGLSQISGSQISVMHNEGLVDTQYEYIGVASKNARSATALNVYSMNYGSIERYDNSNARAGSFNAGSLAASLTYSAALRGDLNWGVNAKYIKESIDSEKASGAAVDLGLLYKSGATKVAFTAQNLGQKMKFEQEEFSLPMRLGVGLARQVGQTLLIAADASKYNDNDLTYHAGLDYSVSRILSLRAGYETTPSNNIDVDGMTGISGGVGLQLSVFTIDYAFRPFGDLGDTHRVSLLIKFNRLNK